MGSGASKQNFETEKDKDFKLLVDDLFLWIEKGLVNSRDLHQNDLRSDVAQQMLKAFNQESSHLTLDCCFTSRLGGKSYLMDLPPHIFNPKVFKHLKNLELKDVSRLLDEKGMVRVHLSDNYKLCNSVGTNLASANLDDDGKFNVIEDGDSEQIVVSLQNNEFSGLAPNTELEPNQFQKLMPPRSRVPIK